MHKVSRSLGLILSEAWSEPFFRIGLIVKLILIIILLPTIQQEWFVPFVVNWIENPITLPWSSHLLSGGDPLAFPYGPIMFIFHLPTTALGWMADILFGTQYFANIGFRISLFGADLLLLLLLLQAFEDHWKRIITYYWLSHLVLFITYWHGQTDLIPVVLFIYALTLIKRMNFKVAAILFACSIAAKHSMIIGVPFVILYLWSHGGNQKEFQNFIRLFIGSLLLFEFPFFFSDSFRMMVLENREIDKIYWLFIDMGKGNLIYLTPLIYMFLLYFFWRIRRVNFDLLLASMGVAFSIVILMTPSPPGWYLWIAPILAIHQSRSGFGAIVLVGFFSLFFITYHLLHTSGAGIILFDFNQINVYVLQAPIVQSIHYTLLIGFGFLIAIQILRIGVRENDYYKLGSRPLTLGIAGDSGVGKSTFSSSLSAIFGKHSTLLVSGDDYHNWDRSSPMWKTFTHLDPKANHLFQFVKDVRSLINGRAIKSRSYDHLLGYFLPNKIRKSEDVIIVEGLHALYPKQLLVELDVRFFIEMDESLRFFLRTNRDVNERNHTEKEVLSEMERRKDDNEKYIKPQAKRADVIFTLMPINMELFEEYRSIKSNIKVRACIKHGIYYSELVKILIGVCGLQVNIESVDENGEVVLEISGDVLSEDISLAANILVPHMEELFDFSVEFSEGVQGIMQVITLMEIDEALKRRRNP